MGLEATNLEWQRLSLCANVEPDWFFKDYESDVEVAKQVDSLCLSCPVMMQCATAGQRGEYGVWGAVYWDGSGKPDKTRNKHKTEVVWETIRTRISD